MKRISLLAIFLACSCKPLTPAQDVTAAKAIEGAVCTVLESVASDPYVTLACTLGQTVTGFFADAPSQRIVTVRVLKTEVRP